MGTTTGGLIYPDATDPVDVAGDLQTLAESVETEFLTGGTWSTSTTGFTLASNFDTLSVRYRIIGPFIDLFGSARRITSAITVGAGDGDITNVDVLSAVPAALIPTQQAYLGSGSTRLAGYIITTGGVLRITAVAGGGVNVAINDTVSWRGLYVRN